MLNMLYSITSWMFAVVIFFLIGSFLIQFKLIGAIILGALIGLAVVLGAD